MIYLFLKASLIRLKYRFFPNKEQAFWAQELFEAQGLGGKIGQLLGQGKKASLPPSTISGSQIENLFNKEFSGSALKLSGQNMAASMGQVFFGKWNSHAVAVKVLHPGIRTKIKKEIQNILVLGHYFAKVKGFQFNKDVFQKFLIEIFEEETNLVRESDFQEKFCLANLSTKHFLIPKVFKEVSNQDFLTQERLDCILARDLKTIPHFDIFHFFFNNLFNHQLLHGDLNDRNWGINTEQKVVVYDFGCSKLISKTHIMGLKNLLQNKDVKNAFAQFGVHLEKTTFSGREQELRDKLFTSLLVEPISPILQYSAQLKKLLGTEVTQLRSSTDPWVLLFMRSLFSLIRIYQDRMINIPLKEILIPYLEFKTNEV